MCQGSATRSAIAPADQIGMAASRRRASDDQDHAPAATTNIATMPRGNSAPMPARVKVAKPMMPAVPQYPTRGDSEPVQARKNREKAAVNSSAYRASGM